MKSDIHWKNIGDHPHHGVCVPLSALRTKNSSGIGEFLDLIPLIAWCKEVHLDCIQLLPLNDSGQDPSPYNPLSSCALDPVYLSLKELGLSNELFQSLTSQNRTARHEVLRLKMQVLRALFEQEFATLSKTASYKAFIEENLWLSSYSLFKALKDQFENVHWKHWPLSYNFPEQKQIDFYSFLQYHCFRQMQQVRAIATEKGVHLKGDIPILISPDSHDVWANLPLFRLDLEAGAPPDLYNPLGQKWGFPLFNWDAMRKENFAWWMHRLKVAERLYHIYRIDHVVGFFRIWAVPKENKPSEGFFIPSDPHEWLIQGREILEMMLASSSLLPIAEDLGTIPKEIYPIMQELGICGTKVVRWQRRWETDRGYIPFNEYTKLSMTTLSTPDMDTLELWWKKFPAESAPFADFMHWPYHPLLNAKQRLSILRAAHHSTSIFHINLLQEYLALYPELVWPNAEDERINYPGSILPTNWTYRFRPYLEEIITHKGLAESLTKIIL